MEIGKLGSFIISFLFILFMIVGFLGFIVILWIVILLRF